MDVECREEVGEGDDTDDGSCQVRLGSSESMEGNAEKDPGTYTHIAFDRVEEIHSQCTA